MLKKQKTTINDIGIIGAGTAGLHLGLRLQQLGVPTTIYSERAPAELSSARLPNTVAHHALTRDRERELGVNHWSRRGCSSPSRLGTGSWSRHVLNDPVGGQGANSASASAWLLAGAIHEALEAGHAFDEAFCQRAEAQAWEAVRAATIWNNALSSIR